MNLEREQIDPEDEVKVLLAQGDEGAAASVVIRRYGPRALRYLRRMLVDKDDVADALSQWSERVWHGLPAFEFRSSLRTWCARLAANVGLNFRDEAWRRRVRRFESGEASALAQSTHSSSENRRRKLSELKEELDGKERTLFFLRVEEELPWAEIADILTSSGDPVDPGAAQKRFERMKDKLRLLARRKRLLD
jgi:RNA polymerase sigma-70 factor (ECF subfamily)